MQSADEGVSVRGYQHINEWGGARQVYELLVRIKKAAKSSDLSHTVDPYCPIFQISWSSVVQTTEVLEEEGSDLILKIREAYLHFTVKYSEPGEIREWKARVAFLNPDNEVVRPSEECHLRQESQGWSRFSLKGSFKIPFFDIYVKVAGMSGHDELKIKIEITPGNFTDELTAFPGNVLVGMAKNMTLPIDWNVEFQAETAAGDTRSLYVHRYILAARSEYYKTMFQSNFFEGENYGVDGTRQGQTTIVQTLQAHEPFEVLHPILYWMYSDRICFTNAPVDATVKYEVPPCDAQEAYRVGDILGLSQLKENALNFLVETTDRSNILTRMFGEFALTYDEIGRGYEKVFYKCWDDIRKTGALTEYFMEIQEEEKEEMIVKVAMRCLKLMEGLKV